jgi:flagellar biosynthesis protein FlhG
MGEDKTIWSVGGGKGGIGKSVATVNIGCALALDGKRVILVDADLGGANLHTYLGIKYPGSVLEDFLQGRVKTLEEVAIPTAVEGLTLISGGGEFLGIANPQHYRKQKLISSITRLKADYIIVDLGAGTTYNVLDFFGVSTQGIVLLVPEPAAIQNAYLFLKSFVYRRLARAFSTNQEVSALIKGATDPRSERCVKTFADLLERIAANDSDRGAAELALSEIKKYRPKLLLNMASSRDDLRVVDAFKRAIFTFLGLKADYIGSIASSPAIKAASKRMRPFMLDGQSGTAKREVRAVVSKLLAASGPGPLLGDIAASVTAPAPAREPSGEERSMPAHREVFGFNDDVKHNGEIFHVQTEAQGGLEFIIETVIYHGGRVFFSKRTGRGELEESAESGTTAREFAGRQHRSAIAAIKTNRITLEGVNK